MARHTGWLQGTVMLAVLLLVAGCGKPSETTPQPPPSQAPAQQPPATAGAQTFKIGVLMPMSGADAARGQAFVNGVKWGIKVLGDSVKLSESQLVVKDIATDPQQGVVAATEIIQTDKPWLLLGLPDAQAVTRLRSELEKAEVPLMTPATGEMTLPALELYVTRLTYPDSSAADALARYVANSPAAQQTVVVANSDRAESLELKDVFRKRFTELRGNVIAQFSYADMVKPERLARMVMMEKPELIFAPLDQPRAVLLIDALRKEGLLARVVGPEWYAPSGFAGPNADYTGVITTGRGYVQSTGAVLAQLDRARLAANVIAPATVDELMGYDAVVVLVSALKSSPTGARDLARAINLTKNLEGTRGTLSMGPDRGLISGVPVLGVKDHAFELLATISAVPEPPATPAIAPATPGTPPEN